MDLTEHTLSSREVFHGRIVRVRVDEVRLPNGKTSSREVIDHPGGVCILALDDQHRAAVVRQYRYAFGRVMTELPAGKMEAGEEPFVTAQRELAEEVGASAAEWTDLGALIPSPGCYAETLHMYLARGLTFRAIIRQCLEDAADEDEFLETEFIPLADLAEQCLSGQLQDAKTVAAVLKARAMGL